jgi:hypothetical protein
VRVGFYCKQVADTFLGKRLRQIEHEQEKKVRIEEKKKEKEGYKRDLKNEDKLQDRKRELYGPSSNPHAKRVAELEAMLNSAYDQITEMKKPRFWPTVGLNLTY